jgi:hypothetical protein
MRLPHGKPVGDVYLAEPADAHVTRRVHQSIGRRNALQPSAQSVDIGEIYRFGFEHPMNDRSLSTIKSDDAPPVAQ